MKPVTPYANFRFRVLWQGRPVAAVSKVSALKRTTEAVSFREGGDPSSVRVSPGQVRFEPITLERGLTLDRDFEHWARQVWAWPAGNGPGADPGPAIVRRDLTLEFRNEVGQVVITYQIYRCWPSEYTALPELDASANAVAIQTLVLQHEGWTRFAAPTPA